MTTPPATETDWQHTLQTLILLIADTINDSLLDRHLRIHHRRRKPR
jgi:hypothetical protein